MHRAAEKGRKDIIECILNSDQNPDINAVSKFGPPIHLAITSEQDEIVQYLLDKKVDLKLRDKDGNTVLHHCIKLKLFNIFKPIFDNICNSLDMPDEQKKEILNAVNSEGNTILHELALKKSFTLIDKLKEISENIRIDPNLKNTEGFDYNQAYENLLKNEKQLELNEIEKRNLIRKEKEKLIEQKYLLEQEEKREEERIKQIEERNRQIGMTLLKYRSFIVGFVVICFLGLIVLIIKNASSKKDFVIY